MNTRQKTNWLIDASLFIGLIACFYLNLTGVEVHQWIGVFGTALAAYHLVIHWNWVIAVTQRFFGRTSGKAQLYYSLDLVMFFGLSVILVTGMVISTWLNLPLTNYMTWLQVHITSSIITLSVTAIKLLLHWRWIVSATRQVLSVPPPPHTRPTPVRVTYGTNQMSRAEFLKVMGVVGATSFLAMVSASATLKLLQNSETSVTEEEEVLLASALGSSSGAVTSSSEQGSAVETTPESTPSATSSTSVLESTSDSASSSVSNSACIVRCNHRCAYPGHCRKYTDSNQNGYCDLGECA